MRRHLGSLIASTPGAERALHRLAGSRWTGAATCRLLGFTLPRRFVERAGEEVARFRRETREHGTAVFGGTAPDDAEARKRMVTDAVASAPECEELVAFARQHAAVGDGYAGRRHPHNEDELFAGVSLSNAAAWPQRGAELARRVASRARERIATYFGLPELWVGVLHLVHRRVINPSSDLGEEMSQVWHRDDGARPGLWWRSHSAILYLNDDFVGGETLLRSPDRRVTPAQGRLLAFTGGPENVHGVAKIRSGERFVLAMWCSASPLLRSQHESIFGGRGC